MLPRIADVVGSEIEVMFDGGIRTGQDVLRALALGAKSCLIGRAYIYGLGAAGERGVAKAIEIIRKELDVSMALTGINSINEVGPSVLCSKRDVAFWGLQRHRSSRKHGRDQLGERTSVLGKAGKLVC